MDLDFTAEQDMLRRSVRGLCERHFPLATVRRLERDSAGHAPDFWAGLQDGGFLALRIAEADGGAGLGSLDAVVVAEELGRALVLSPYIDSSILVARLIALAGTKAERTLWLSRIAEGAIVVPGWFEAEEAFPGALSAEIADGALLLNGARTLVPFADSAHRLAVPVRHPAILAEIVIALVDPAASEVAIEPQANLASLPLAKVSFTDVVVPLNQCIGLEGGSRAAWNAAFAETQIIIAAEAIGGAERALEITVAYAKERRQFDRPIGEFQALQHRAAILYSASELARALVQRALVAAAADPHAARRTVSQAKARAGRTATLAVQEAVQMHGGMGMTDDLDLGLFMKRARVLEELFGDAGFHTDRAARLGGY